MTILTIPNKALLFCVAFIFSLSTPAQAADYEAQVLRVTDGDTIVVRTADFQDVKIRLYGVDAPEAKQPGGPESTAFLQTIYGHQVKVTEMGIDRYGRTVALVEFEGQSVNLGQVAHGQAWYYGRYCKAKPICPQIKAAETEARKGKRGLWAGEAVEPWKWRRRK